MICDVCKKEQATVHLTEIHDGSKCAKHLCPSCAVAHSSVGQEFSFTDLFAGLTEARAGARTNDLTCSGCGLTFEEFRKSGRLGCGTCYHDFREQLMFLLKKIRGPKIHSGKKPSLHKVMKTASPLKQLQRQLEAAIATEQYELAAQLRDRIREMQKAKGSKANRESK
jgi:protein arginine kinase activator